MSAAIYSSSTHAKLRTQNFSLLGADREATYILSWNLKFALQNYIISLTVKTFSLQLHLYAYK
jgi:hypothetical protein